MQKSALQKMYIEFPEIFTKMLADEMKVCIQAMRQKALLLDFLESQNGVRRRKNSKLRNFNKLYSG